MFTFDTLNLNLLTVGLAITQSACVNQTSPTWSVQFFIKRNINLQIGINNY